jgi:hypothetical protein
VSEDVLMRKGRWDTPRFAQNNPLRPCLCARQRTQVTLQDGVSHTTYAYSGNTVTVADPGGHWKKYTMDVFGNVTQVNEPNPAGGADYVTHYAYNAFDKLTTVTMPRIAARGDSPGRRYRKPVDLTAAVL